MLCVQEVAMKTLRTLLALLAALAASFAAAPASAWDGHHHGPRVGIGLHFGIPIGPYPYYYGPYPYYYYSPYYYPPVVVQQQPPVYIEQAPAPQAQQAPASAYWYYCADSRAYYPYVKECPAGWQRVAPQPQN